MVKSSRCYVGGDVWQACNASRNKSVSGTTFEFSDTSYRNQIINNDSADLIGMLSLMEVVHEQNGACENTLCDT